MLQCAMFPRHFAQQKDENSAEEKAAPGAMTGGLYRESVYPFNQLFSPGIWWIGFMMICPARISRSCRSIHKV